jgi:transketolase
MDISALPLATCFSYDSSRSADFKGGFMSDESTTALREIAELLKKRVEQEDAVAARTLESSKRGAEMTARFQARTEEAQARSEEMRRRSEEMRKQFSPENRESFRAEMEHRREEDRQFRKSLLDELHRHNSLLTEIIERLQQSPKE